MDRKKRRRLNKADSTANENNEDARSHGRWDSGETLLRNAIRQRLHGRARAVPCITEEAQRKVSEMLKKTVDAGESNSMLLIGPRGSGKTRSVEDAIAHISATTADAFHVVRLNGLIQRDDRLALREIMRQLGRQMAEGEYVEDEAKNYSDTLTKLIATLSSPNTSSNPTSQQHNDHQVAKSVIFVLDEFDLFASHPRQTLLYNLFDIAQSSSRRTPIAVLGMTTKVNAVDMLEKRVKSRYSHRSAYFKPADTLTSFHDTCFSALHLSRPDLSEEELTFLKNHGGVEEQLKAWKTTMEQWFHCEEVINRVTYEYHVSKSIPNALAGLAHELSRATRSVDRDAKPSIRYEQGSGTIVPDNKLSMVPQLPVLALSLLICAARLELVHDSDLVNFNMVYDEYVTLISRFKAVGLASSGGSAMSRVWSAGMSLTMWNYLVHCELLISASATGNLKRVVERTEMCRIDVSLEEVRDTASSTDAQLKEWCKI